MKFEEVLPILRQGKKARTLRQKNKEDYYQCCEKGILRYILPELNSHPPYIYTVDIMSDDWEIIDNA